MRTQSKWTTQVAIVSLGVVVCLAFSIWYFLIPRMGDRVVDVYEADNGVFRIRVTAYAEKRGFVSGAYYLFQCSSKSVDDWRKIMVFRHDDAIPIRRDQIHFLAASSAYLFMGWMYAVTVDGGKSWSVWNAEEDLVGWRCCNYEYLQGVDLGRDGNGIMHLDTNRDVGVKLRCLYTQDYGRHWGPR